MKTEVILSPRFTGDRFANHTLPLSLLKDLEALQGIIIEIARAEFIEAHPGRRRLPRGFGEALTLHLAGTEDGSFIPHLAVLVMPALFGEPPELTAARAAANRFVDAIAEAQTGSGSKRPLPEAAWPHIERFGRGLRDDEAVVLAERGGGKVALTKEVRRRLLLARSGAQAVTDEVQVVALLSGVQQRTISVLLDGEHVLTALLSDAQLGELQDVRVGDFRATWLQIDGIGSFDRAGQLQRLDEVQAIERLDAGDPSVQLEKLKLLKDGWHDGAGAAPDKALLKRVRGWFNEHLTENMPLPRLFPTPEGGVEAEWLVGRHDVSVEFDPHAKSVEWHALNLETRQLDEKAIPLNNADGLRELGQHMATFFERLSFSGESAR